MESENIKVLWREFRSLKISSYYIPFEKLRKVLTLDLALRCVEDAYRYTALARSELQMPSKEYFFYEDGDMRIMPAVAKIDGEIVTGMKIVSVHFNNPKSNLPTVIGFFVLVDSKTGSLLSVFDATYLTAMRTGASGAVSAKYFLKDKERIKVGIIGCGVQARTQIIFLSHLKKIEELLIYDISEKAMEGFSSFVKRIGLSPRIAKTLYDFSKCDIVITLTPSREPFVMPEHVENVKLINAMGADAPGKQELHPQILRDSTIIVDNLTQSVHAGEINVPLKNGEITQDMIFGEIGEVIAGLKTPPDNRRIVFDSTGIAILDLFVGFGVYKSAREKGLLKSFKIH